MKTLNKILIATSVVFALSSSLAASSERQSDINLIGEVVLKQQQEIDDLKKQIKKLSEHLKISSNSITYKHKIINVKQWANYRDKPWGKILKQLPPASKLNIEECSLYKDGLTWCKSPDFGGGYISSKLISWEKGK